MKIILFRNIVFTTTLLVLFVGCSTPKNTYSYKDLPNKAIAYTEEVSCLLNFSKEEYASYNAFDCLHFKYNFSRDEYRQIKSILKFHLKRTSFKHTYISISEVTNGTTSLYNANYFGLFELSTLNKGPNFYFLRTERGLFFFKCNKVEKYESILENSTLDNSLRTAILNFIDKRCSGGGMLWYNLDFW